MNLRAISIGVFLPLLMIGCTSTARRERILREDLSLIRFEINQYTRDHQKRPFSLSDLVDAGYMKQLPIDPFTGRRDTWVPELSGDQNNPGITDVRSGRSQKTSAEYRVRTGKCTD